MAKFTGGVRAIQQIREAVSHLNPNEVKESVKKPFHVSLLASSDTAYRQMEAFFAGNERSPSAVAQVVHRVGDSALLGPATVQVVEEGLSRPQGAFTLNPERPQQFICDVLEQRSDLNLALAREFPAFRQPVVMDVVRSVSKENAMFSLATAIPGIMPLISLPLSIGEFASDTAFLTMNQIRMAFLIAAAHGHDVGYREQKGEVGSIVAGGFGWRAIARELVGKIPLGGGLIPKAAIAYAGTYVVGVGLDRYYRFGSTLADSEKRAAYELALERGKAVAAAIVENARKMRGASGRA